MSDGKLVPLHFSTNITKAEVLRTILRGYFRPLNFLKEIGIWIVVVSALMMFWLGLAKAMSDIPSFLIASFGGALGSCAALLAMNLIRAWLLSPKLPGLLGTHYFEVREEGLFEKTDVNETLWKWQTIVAVRNGKDWIEVEVQAGSIYSIPPGTFSSEAQVSELAEEMRRRIAASVPG